MKKQTKTRSTVDYFDGLKPNHTRQIVTGKCGTCNTYGDGIHWYISRGKPIYFVVPAEYTDVQRAIVYGKKGLHYFEFDSKAKANAFLRKRKINQIQMP